MKLRIFIILFLSSIIYSQNIVRDNADVRAIVDEQIKDAKSKNSIVEEEKNNEVSFVKQIEEILINSKTSILKGFFLIDASILAAIIVLWRRRNLRLKLYRSKNIKDNISLLREEKIGPEYSGFNKSRNRISQKDSVQINGGESITKLAKKLSISKGEIHLAAKIKMLANG